MLNSSLMGSSRMPLGGRNWCPKLIFVKLGVDEYSYHIYEHHTVLKLFHLMSVEKESCMNPLDETLLELPRPAKYRWISKMN